MTTRADPSTLNVSFLSSGEEKLDAVVVLFFWLPYYQETMFISIFFISIPCNIFPKIWYICCLERIPKLWNGHNIFYFFAQKPHLFRRNSQNVTENNVSNSQIIWVNTWKIYKVGIGRTIKFAWTFSYFGLLANVISQKQL